MVTWVTSIRASFHPMAHGSDLQSFHLPPKTVLVKSGRFGRMAKICILFCPPGTIHLRYAAGGGLLTAVIIFLSVKSPAARSSTHYGRGKAFCGEEHRLYNSHPVQCTSRLASRALMARSFSRTVSCLVPSLFGTTAMPTHSFPFWGESRLIMWTSRGMANGSRMSQYQI